MKEKIFDLIHQGMITSERISQLTGLEEDIVNNILNELVAEKRIFLNVKNKYEEITDKYSIGELVKTSPETCYVNVSNRKVKIDSNSLNCALKNDLVVIMENDNNYGEIKGILKRRNNKLVCEVKEDKNKLVLVPFNEKCNITLITSRKLLKDYIIGDLVYINLNNEVNEDNVIVVKDIKKIGHYHDENCVEYAIAISKGFSTSFSEEALLEASLVKDKVMEDEKIGRLDLTKENVFTIDSVHTKDMDDAVSIKKLQNGNYELGVHIADITHYIKPGMKLFKEAVERATSAYLGEVVIPMFPSELSNGIFSLNEGVDRLTKSCIIEIDNCGNIINYRLEYSVINSKMKMSYEEINELFKGNFIEEYAPFMDDLINMRALSHILTMKKNNKGYLEFSKNEVNIKKDIYNNDKILGFDNCISEEAEKMVENFMVLANEMIATDFYWRGLPFIYRTHDLPNDIRLDTAVKQIKELGLGKKLIRL